MKNWRIEKEMAGVEVPQELRKDWKSTTLSFNEIRYIRNSTERVLVNGLPKFWSIRCRRRRLRGMIRGNLLE